MPGEQAMTDADDLPCFLRRPGRRQDHPTLAADLVQIRVDRRAIARQRFHLQRLGAHPAREAAIQDDQQAFRGDARAPFAERRQRYRRLFEIEGFRVVSDKFMGFRAVSRERDDHDIVGIGPGELLEILTDGGERRLMVHEQNGLAAQRVREERVQCHRIPAGASEPVNPR